MKKLGFGLLCILCCLSGLWANEDVNLPANFPSFTAVVHDANAIDDGYIFLAVAAEVEGIGYYLMVLNNDGTPYKYKELSDHYSYDFKVQPNGLLSCNKYLHDGHVYTGGGHSVTLIMDHNLEIVEEIQMKNGYIAEAHDFQLLPNGNAWLIGYYMSREDMSDNVEGGHPSALVSGGVVQELDAWRNAIFQWRTWDHDDLSSYVPTRGATRATLSAYHLNTINQDIDGHIILGTPSVIHKIDRSTGDIIWTLGRGDDNDFELIGEGASDSHFGGHATYRIPNGNFLMYDNGGRGSQKTSFVHEYKLNEEAMTAELIWTYTPPTDIPAWHRGNAQRLPNGNTFIGWGGASGKPIPTCSEVTPDKEVVFELFFDEPAVESYRALRLPFPGDEKGIEVMDFELATGNTYEFADDNGDTGVTLKVIDRTGDGYNEVTVKRMPFAPLAPEFPGKAPAVLPLRFTLDQFGIDSFEAQLRIDAADLGADPNALTVYYRPYADRGLFIPLPTAYNPAKDQVQTTITGFGEIALGYPDSPDVALVPWLNQPESAEEKGFLTPHPPLADANTVYTVNQAAPIALSWSPQGFATGYELQVATDAAFENLVVEESFLVDAVYTFEGAAPDTLYHWRVKTFNEAGDSDWATGSFQTVAPMVEVTSPNGGEVLERGASVYIQWQDNLQEEVVIDLLKGGAVVASLGTEASRTAFDWDLALDLEPGADYRIAVKSSVDGNVIDTSDADFAIE